jgi:N4-gp56 family major capsid protein
MADLTFLTTSTNFNQTVVTLVVKQLVESLRYGLPWLPRGSVKNAVLIPGTNGTARFVNIKDLADISTTNLTEGVTPEGQDLAHDYVNVTTTQKGGFVRASDLAAAESPFNVAEQMAGKVTRQAQVALDSIAKATYAAQAADIIRPTTTIAAADIVAGVALMRRRGVAPLSGGLYVGVVGPELAGDIALLSQYVSAVEFDKPELLQKGTIGEFKGVAFIESPREITSLSVARGAVTSVAATDVITSTAHGLKEGQRIQFASLTGGAGLSINTDYFVIGTNLTANDFMVSATRGGATIDHTSNITAGTFKGEVKRLQLIGENSLAFGDLTSLEVMTASGATTSDPIAQRITCGWKARLGASLIKLDETDPNGTDVVRTVGIEVPASYQAP